MCTAVMTGESIEEGVFKLEFCEVHLDLSFTELHYHVPHNKGKTKKHILRNVSGAFYHGKLTAILGPSGAGKSSLLNVLSGFRTKGVSGSIMVNGIPRDAQEFRKHSCYITQDCAMFTQLTAQETLLFAASLRLDRGISIKKKLGMIMETLELLGLQNVGDTPVGSMSGGERKRLSIALELLRNPPVMFFDEPTSGLDSSSCLQVISHLKRLAQGGRTIVCSIHQPSSRIMGIFDDLFLLSEGQCLYRGTVTEMSTVLGTEGFLCPTFYNPADFAIEVASGERGCTEPLAALYSCDIKVVPGLGDTDTAPMLVKSVNEVADRPPLPRGETLNFPLWYQFFVLFKRSLLCTSRDLMQMKLRVGTHVFVGLLLGGVYFGIGNEASKIFSNTACLFFFLLFLFFSNSLPTVITYPSEAAVFLREHHNNWYSLGAYFFSKLIADLPLLILCPTLFLTTGYCLTDQPLDGTRFLQFWLVCFLLTIMGQALGLAIGAAFNAEMGVFLVPSSSIPMMLFSGFFLNLRDIPECLTWMSHISYFRHTFEAIMLTVYGYDRPNLRCSQPYCHFKSAKKFLQEFSMDRANYFCDIVQVLAWTLVFQIALFCVLKWRLRMAR